MVHVGSGEGFSGLGWVFSVGWGFSALPDTLVRDKSHGNGEFTLSHSDLSLNRKRRLENSLNFRLDGDLDSTIELERKVGCSFVSVS